MRTATSCLFLDIGGVLLTNGWDHHARRRAVAHFGLDWDETESRHQLNVAAYEEGRLSLEDYLSRVVFDADRAFTREQVWEFMVAQSLPDTAMLGLFTRLKARYGFKVAVVSNEARELNAYRIRKFELGRLADCFVSSCYVHVRKPDPDIFRMALDITQAAPGEVLFVENTPQFVRIAEGLGIPSVLHTDYHSTRAKLASLGLQTGVLARIVERMEALEKRIEAVVIGRLEKDWYTTEEVAVLLNRAPWTVRQHCLSGRIRAKKRGGATAGPSRGKRLNG